MIGNCDYGKDERQPDCQGLWPRRGEGFGGGRNHQRANGRHELEETGIAVYQPEQLMNTLTITLPIPPVAVRPNGRAHWAKKMKAVKRMRERACGECIVALRTVGDRWTRARIRIDWYHKTARFLDRDNIIASCKAYIDGICDAGIIADDVGVTYEPVGRHKDKDNPRVEITVTKEAEDD